MQKAGLKQLPKDASFANYMVAQDLNFVALAFHRMSGNGEAVSAGHQCAMEVLYAKYLQQEREAPGYLAGKEKDKDKKEDPLQQPPTTRSIPIEEEGEEKGISGVQESKHNTCGKNHRGRCWHL